MVSLMGIWANTGEEAVYFGAFRDAEEQTLDGSKSYVIHFPADGHLESVVNAYWCPRAEAPCRQVFKYRLV